MRLLRHPGVWRLPPPGFSGPPPASRLWLPSQVRLLCPRQADFRGCCPTALDGSQVQAEQGLGGVAPRRPRSLVFHIGNSAQAFSACSSGERRMRHSPRVEPSPWSCDGRSCRVCSSPRVPSEAGARPGMAAPLGPGMARSEQRVADVRRVGSYEKAGEVLPATGVPGGAGSCPLESRGVACGHSCISGVALGRFVLLVLTRLQLN